MTSSPIINKYILVCGGAGYIGSHTVLRLLRTTNYSVVVYDNFITGFRSAVDRIQRMNNGEFAQRLFVEQGELSDTEKLSLVFEKYQSSNNGNVIEAVMHFCALISVAESVTDPLSYYDNNFCATLKLLQVMQKYHCHKLIFSSTAAVFGDVKSEDIPVSSDAPRDPVNPYGETKLAVEKMLHWLTGANPQFKYVCLRYFNACGADDSGLIGEAHEPETHLIPVILQVALGQRSSIKMFGADWPTEDGTCVRDYVHVNDLASAHISALRYLDTHQSLKCNLGSGKGYSVKQVIEACKRVTGHAIPVEEAPRREGDPACLVASSDVAERELNWVRQYDDIEKIVATAWNWHKSNPHGYKEQK